MGFDSRVNSVSLAACWLLAAALAAPAHAQEHLDITFQENDDVDARLSVHGRDFGAPKALRIILDKRVYGRSLLLNQGFSLVQDDPGFTASEDPDELAPVPLVAPVPNEDVWFNVLAAPPQLTALGGRNLSHWDGVGTPSWGPVPDNEGFEICEFDSTCAIGNTITVDGSTNDVTGFVIDATDNEGGMHSHMRFVLLPDNGELPPEGPDDGVYLMLMEGTLEPYAEWVPFYVMFEVYAGGAATVNAAIADVEANFLQPLCSDGIDNDRDGLIDHPADPGCDDANDMSERGGMLAAECDNGFDDDMNDLTDFPNDPGCTDAFDVTELPEPGGTTPLLAGWLLAGYLERRKRRRA